MKNAQDSFSMQDAYAIIDSVRGKPQSLEERKSSTISLAKTLLLEANRIIGKEKKAYKKLALLMHDPNGKSFITCMTDQCFRSSTKKRVISQLNYLLEEFGIPRFLPWTHKCGFKLFRWFSPYFPAFFFTIVIWMIRKETSNVILPGESKALEEYLQKRTQEGIKLNLNRLGEAILSEEEAERRLQVYLKDFENPLIHYISIKISTIYSQINLLAWESSKGKIKEKLRILYRSAMKHTYRNEEGIEKYKFVNLDMEEYKDLHLTVEIFREVLSEPEFYLLSAGIVLQSYIPDSFSIQQELTNWARERVKNGGAPIKIRIVKGANLAMEQVESSLKHLPQPPYLKKTETDANYKKMILFGLVAENARAVHIGVASHNLFDISFAILLRAENQVEPYVQFEMLEGMAEHIRKVVQNLTSDILLYCPIATKKDFRNAIAYLIRRLDENTGEDNFLCYLFGLEPGTANWERQVTQFLTSCDSIHKLSMSPRREQDRTRLPPLRPLHNSYEEEATTDFSLPQNRVWGEKIVQKYLKYAPPPIPLVINGENHLENQNGQGFSPSSPNTPLFHYMLAESLHLELALKTAKQEEENWSKTSISSRSELLHKTAQNIREKRGKLLGVMMLEGGKTLLESDPEISEAVDFIEYYYRQMEKFLTYKDLRLSPKGTILVAPPWNFPVAIPVGGIAAALITGNCVIFKPAPEAVLSGWHLVNAFWDAGISKKTLQFINCNDDPEGSKLVQDERINCIILTGATATAKKFLQLRPGLDLAAETGGKNAMIITSLSDRDLAIKDLLQSAFGHSGQKCSATSVVILEKEVYDDPEFKRQLQEATTSLRVGLSHDLSTKISPLIKKPSGNLLKGLTTLENNEEWLTIPTQHPSNPNLWSPGIKWGVQPGSFTQKTEFFGPVLAVIRAENLDHAIEIANNTEYGLTGGLHSLDLREQKKWLEKIEVGNAYINRTMTGAIVRRQPFGGYKNSSFGNGSKAGGPNYLREFLHFKQEGLPQEKLPVTEKVNSLTTFLGKIPLTSEQLGVWYASICSYAYWWKKMSQKRDPSKLLGEDNFFYYLPRNGVSLRINIADSALDYLRVIAAALTCESPLEISVSNKKEEGLLKWIDLVPLLCVLYESEEGYLQRMQEGAIKRVRLLSKPTQALREAAAGSACHIADSPVLANGRFELLHYVREVSLSIDYHRYGNLGTREGEQRRSPS